MKSDLLLLTCVFEKFVKVSTFEFGINPLYCVSQPGFTYQCGLNYTGINLQTLQDKDIISTLEINLCGCISSVLEDRYVKSDANKKILYIDATNLFGCSMIQILHYDENEMWHGDPNLYMKKLEEISITSDDSDIGYFIEVDLRYPDNIKKAKNIPFCPKRSYS